MELTEVMSKNLELMLGDCDNSSELHKYLNKKGKSKYNRIADRYFEENLKFDEEGRIIEFSNKSERDDDVYFARFVFAVDSTKKPPYTKIVDFKRPLYFNPSNIPNKAANFLTCTVMEYNKRMEEILGKN
jgi:hypothetical protein